jgi:hypothetical protein
MRESVFVRVNGALNRQHVRGSESHVPPSIGLSFAPPILRRNGSAHSSNVTRLGTDAYTIVSSEGRDCNQRLITNGCEAAFAARGAGMIVSLAVGSSGKKSRPAASQPPACSQGRYSLGSTTVILDHY